MAAFAYLLGPLTGAVAYFMGRDARTRFHGGRAVGLGVLWPLLLYLAAAVSPAATAALLVAGIALWLGLLVVTALGHDLRLPGDGALRAWTEHSPREG